jgi:hypothetical protein
MTEAEKFLVLIMWIVAAWIISCYLPPIPRLRRPQKEPRQPSHVQRRERHDDTR